MAKRVPTGKPKPGEQRNQSSLLTGLVTFTGSTVVDLQRSIKRRAGVDFVSYEVTALNFEDAGGVATVHRLASQKSLTTNTFTINASKETGAAGVYAVATNPCTVRWTVLVTS